jgi:hypothetical protein
VCESGTIYRHSGAIAKESVAMDRQWYPHPGEAQAMTLPSRANPRDGARIGHRSRAIAEKSVAMDGQWRPH